MTVRKLRVEYDSEGIREVKSTWDEAEANTLIATGKWIVMHAGVAHKDNGGFQVKPIIILARIAD